MLRRTTSTAAPGRFSKTEFGDWSSFKERLHAKSVYNPKTFAFPPAVPGTSDMFQKSLMRLPIPKLEDTCRRYLETVRPLVPPTSFERTEKITKEFQSGTGAKLHETLVAKDKVEKHTSYINADWFDLYLRDRAPLPIHYTPFLILRNEANPTPTLEKVAYMTAILTRWFYRFKRNEVPPEVFFFGSPKHRSQQSWFLNLMQHVPERFRTPAIMFGSSFHAFPLDMSQFKSAFATTRVPGKEVDTIACYSHENVTHILVNYRGYQYRVNVCEHGGKAESVEQSAANVLASLEAIIGANPKENEFDVGSLTSDKRDTWYDVRAGLSRDPGNQASLDSIDRALFVINLDLDDMSPVSLNDTASVNRMNKGFMAKPTNRWWDKSISLNVTNNGVVGVNFEHSWGDGVAVLRTVVDLFGQYMQSVEALKKNRHRPDAGCGWEQLPFKLDSKLKSSVKKAQTRLISDLDNTDYYCLVYPKFGKKDGVFKTEMKPDPFVQVAFQLAWWRLHKSTVSTYESASTAAFLHGRTECIRSATSQSQAFTVGMENPSLSDEEKYDLLVKAVEKHAAVSKDAKMGQGVDRHLFALRKTAEREGVSTAFFEDPSYGTMGSNMLSTSTLFSEALMTGGFGPVSPGYGVGYGVAEDLMLFSISAWKKGGPGTSCEEYADALYSALDDMYKLATNVGLTRLKKKN
eukprot:PhM_4_TR7219/c0_g1_i1/m.89865/K08766/CPT2; carnitine O-palmitoyltransferase 2